MKMSTKRSEQREKIMTILYQVEMYKKNKYEYSLEDVIKENTDIRSDFINNIVNGVIEKEQSLNEIANKYLKNWPKYLMRIFWPKFRQ